MKQIDREAISQNVFEAIEEMKRTGIPMAQDLANEVGEILKGAFEYLQDTDLQALYNNIGKVAAANFASFLIMWEKMQEFIDEAIDQGRDLVKTALPVVATALPNSIENVEELVKQSAEATNDIAEAAAEAAKEHVKHVAILLTQVIDQMKQIDREAISQNVFEAIEEMKRTGIPMAQDLANEVGEILKGAFEYLQDTDLQALYNNIGKVAAANFASFLIMWEKMQEFIDEAIDQGRDLVKTALPVVATAIANVDLPTEEVTEQITNVAESIVSTVEDIYDAEVIQGVIGDSFDGIEETYIQSRDAIRAAMNGLIGIGIGGCGGRCAESCPLLRIEIFRDFAQTISLFFSNLYTEIESQMTKFAKVIFGGVSNLVAIDVAEALQSEAFVTIGLYILLVAASVSFILCAFVLYKSIYGHQSKNEIRDGHEARTWTEIEKKSRYTVKFTTYAITGCLTVYLPVAKFCIELITESQNSLLVNKLSSLSPENKTELLIGKFISVILLLFFVIPLPIVFYRLIQNNKPSGSPENPDIVYDVDGIAVPFDDKAYHRMIENDPDQQKCPYISLYKGFERRWAYYKVVQLLFKLLLAVSLIALTGASQAYVSFAIYTSLACVSFYTTPFVDEMNDVMDSVGRIAAIVTGAGGVIFISLPKWEMSESIIGLLVNFVNIMYYLVVMFVFVSGNKMIMKKVKNMCGKFTFSDTVLHIENGTVEQIVPRWDVERESKHRIWHVFWEGILLHECEEKVAIRLLELQDATRNSGIANIRAHWNGQNDPKIMEMRKYCCEHLEGVDVYWNNPISRDGKLDSKTCFGKMYIVPYPFHAIMVYDDANDESFIRDDNLTEFYTINRSSEIVHKRTTRQKLRCLSRWNGEINFPFSRIETETVRDGTKTETYTDNDGNEQTREVPNYSTVRFTCYYTNGRINVGANTERKMAAGFIVTMSYYDGHGSAVLPKTGQTHHFSNRTAQMGQSHIGLHDDMNETPTLRSIFDKTSSVLESQMPQLLSEHNDYRQQMITRHQESNKILGDGFWYFVFNNPKISREALTGYLLNQEINEAVRSIPTRHVAGLNFLYCRLAFVNLNPAIRLWYVFWDDFYYQNKDMHIVNLHENDFSPLKSNSICYQVMQRDKLEIWLEKRNMMGSPVRFVTSLFCKPILFNESNLGVLYGELFKLQSSHSANDTRV